MIQRNLVPFNYVVGDKVKFEGERTRYTVKAKSERFVICTRPFNLKRTVFYTIIDLKRSVRGANNKVFSPYDYKEQADIDKCLVDLISGDCEVSHRNYIMLDIVEGK